MKLVKKEARMSTDARLAVLETTLLDLRQDIKRGFDKIEAKFRSVDERFNRMESSIDSRFNRVDDCFNHIKNRMWSNFLWLMGMIVGLAGLIAHTQHWI
jgi:hypothetical protein